MCMITLVILLLLSGCIWSLVAALIKIVYMYMYIIDLMLDSNVLFIRISAVCQSQSRFEVHCSK